MFNHDHTEQFIKDHSQAVLSSLDSEGSPHSSTIYYIYIKPDIFFMTKSDTEKYSNMVSDNRVALTISDPAKPIAVNLTGLVQSVDDQGQHDKIMGEILAIAQRQLKDYAPIVKLHAGSFKALRFAIKSSTYTDFTKPIGKVEFEHQEK